MSHAKSYLMARQTGRSDEVSGPLEGIRKRLADLNGSEQLAATALREVALAIEELRVAEEELRQQNQQLIAAQLDIELERQRYRELFDLAPDAYLVTDVAGVVREANQSATKLLRIEPHFLIGKSLAAFVALEDRSRFRRELAALSPNRWAQRLTLRLEPREAAQIYASVMVSIARNPDGKPAGLRWLVRDVTAQRRMESEIRSLNEELERRVAEGTEDLTAANRLAEDLLHREQAARRAAEASEAQSRHVQKLESIGVLAGGIAHDFNNLLHVALGNADIAIQRLPPDSPAREPLRDAIQATLHAADLTRQMLAYSGKGGFVIRDLDLSREVREMGT
ncbi:MAG: PAS domain-containing protein, partial [Gemmatimonadales bacterium]